MRPNRFIVRLFLLGGGLLAVLGVILWFLLPIKLTFPPFLPTAFLAMAYGLICLKPCAKVGSENNKPSPGVPRHESGT